MSPMDHDGLKLFSALDGLHTLYALILHGSIRFLKKQKTQIQSILPQFCIELKNFVLKIAARNPK